jgi:hypothetical protein
MRTVQPAVFQMVFLLYTFASTLIDYRMKKFDYIRLSHSETNRKIWDSIIERYVDLRRKNRSPAILWIIAASFAFGGIAIIGWLSSFFMVFKDLRYTPHYLRTVITSLRMTKEQAHSFLDATLLDYKNRLSYGNIPVKEQKRIETTFELLYREFGIPEPENNADVAGNIQELAQVVSESNSELKMISTYTAWKHEVEIEEVQRKQQLQDEQAKRKTSAHNREKGRMLDSFESVLTDEQLDIIVHCCNGIRMFTRDIEVFEMRDILACSHKEPLQVSVNKHLTVLFDRLSKRKLICTTWMSVAERRACFISKKGKTIVSKDLSSALSTASLIKQEIEDRINECIDAVMDSD